VQIPLYGDISGDIGYPDLMQVMEQTAQRYVERIADRPGMPPKRLIKVLTGAPASQLVAYVEENHIDLVIMTSHGRGGLSRAAYGSVTDRLLGGCAPVLVVKPAGMPAVRHES